MNLTTKKNWKTMPAEEFCLKVADGTHDSPKESREGNLLVTSKNIKNGILDLSSSYKISKNDFEGINKRSKVDQWDVLFSMIGTVGEVCIVKEKPEFAIKNVGLFKCGDKTKALFLYYFLSSKEGKEIALSLLNGTTQKYITLGELRSFPVSVPESLDEQREIAGVLGCLDDKIELLRKENKTLEEIAQTLFKEWFVNFNFPGAIGRMIDSELGKIPEGWRAGRLGEVCNISIGRTPPRKEEEWFLENPNDVKWISIKDMGTSGAYIFQTSEYLTQEAVENFNIPVIPENTVVVSFKMTLGRTTITTETMLSNEAIAHLKLRDENKIFSEFLYLFIKNFDFNTLGSTSSIVTAVNSQSIKGIDILIPDSEVLVAFEVIVKPIFKKLKMNSQEIQTLSKLRDGLLDKIFGI